MSIQQKFVVAFRSKRWLLQASRSKKWIPAFARNTPFLRLKGSGGMTEGAVLTETGNQMTRTLVIWSDECR